MSRSLGLSLLASLLLAACGSIPNSNTSAAVYKQDQAMTMAATQGGTLLAVQPVKIEQDAMAAKIIGGGVGALLGGVAGHAMGGGSGKKVLTGLGAVGGALGGAAAGEHLGGKVDGWALMVHLDRGGEVQIVQAQDGQSWQPGMRVNIVELNVDGRRTHRVAPAQ